MGLTPWTRTLSSEQYRMSHCALRYTYIGDGMESSIGLEHRICPMKSHKYLVMGWAAWMRTLSTGQHRISHAVPLHVHHLNLSDGIP